MLFKLSETYRNQRFPSPEVTEENFPEVLDCIATILSCPFSTSRRSTSFLRMFVNLTGNKYAQWEDTSSPQLPQGVCYNNSFSS